MITIDSKHYDKVISSYFLTGHSDYKVTIEFLHPLINKLDIQRKIQSEKFYKRLEVDLAKGCIMPPLTLAFIDNSDFSEFSSEEFEEYVNSNLKKCFVLDGIQRLNTLKRVYDKKQLNLDNPIFLNILICKSRDNLLYRMVTLNNGQKPMSARHQIEMLASHIYDFESLGIEVITEKETAKRRPRNAFRKADVISAFIAFLSGTTNLENSKIIESKMDELIARKIIESDIATDGVEFTDVITCIAKFCEDEENCKWLKNQNNLIGFCTGAKNSLKELQTMDEDDFNQAINNFEEAFKNFDVSKIKLSRERRKLSQYFIRNIEELQNADSDDLLLIFNELD